MITKINEWKKIITESNGGVRVAYIAHGIDNAFHLDDIKLTKIANNAETEDKFIELIINNTGLKRFTDSPTFKIDKKSLNDLKIWFNNKPEITLPNSEEKPEEKEDVLIKPKTFTKLEHNEKENLADLNKLDHNGSAYDLIGKIAEINLYDISYIEVTESIIDSILSGLDDIEKDGTIYNFLIGLANLDISREEINKILNGEEFHASFNEVFDNEDEDDEDLDESIKMITNINEWKKHLKSKKLNESYGEEYSIANVSRHNVNNVIDFLDSLDISYDLDGPSETISFDLTELDGRSQKEVKALLGITESFNEAKKDIPSKLSIKVDGHNIRLKLIENEEGNELEVVKADLPILKKLGITRDDDKKLSIPPFLYLSKNSKALKDGQEMTSKQFVSMCNRYGDEDLDIDKNLIK